ncbi:hypothetical protein MCNS_02140 [Mycobacterium conspicuum]|uniref:Uncharacterized protein n=1 Tax=Mycobacterium conspicuum TaxID=44010 RepID=A0A7I7Y8C7_9MYCO|nr:hypothetical protein MCNS_02140 [Mycobacterium conspicuum]
MNGESLLDTGPGRLFVKQLRWGYRASGVTPTAFVGALDAKALIRDATWAVGRHLYSDDRLEVSRRSPDYTELQQFATAALEALSKLSTLDSPQIHQGTISSLAAPVVCNDPWHGLPIGSFWTSTPLNDEDSWLLCGENLRRNDPRWEVHFDITRVRLARIDSARDWIDLIDSNPLVVEGDKYPDWPAIAESWDAVHLSPTGLLLAHPPRYATVAHWSAVATAWLNRPPDMELRAVR